MNSKLSWHFQGGAASWAVGHVNRSGARYVKLIDPPNASPFAASVRVIGRAWIGGDGVEGEFIGQREHGALRYYLSCQAAYERAPYVYAWEGPNEPAVRTIEQRSNLVAFTVEWTRLMHEAGRRVVVLNLGEGNPEPDAAPELSRALEEADFVGLHEYGAPTMQNGAGWHCLRYRQTVEKWRNNGANGTIPPILIGETGIDGGVIEKPKTGWKTWAGNEQVYQQSLAWYESEIAQDPLIQAAFVFTAAPNNEWADFEVTEGLSAWLRDRPRGEHMHIDGRGMEAAAFADYVAALGLKGKYNRIVIHHSAHKPGQWLGYTSLKALQAYYESQGWDSGPHLFIDSQRIWLFTPLEEDGTGVTGHNHRTRHIEIVGDFTDNLPDPATYRNAVVAAAALLQAGGLGVDALGYHRQLEATQCPGDAFIAQWAAFVAQVAAGTGNTGPDAEVGDAATLMEKLRWWLEEEQRLREQGKDAEANALRLGVIRLAYRVEATLKG